MTPTTLKRIVLLLVAIALAAAAVAFAEPPPFTATLEKSDVALGDRVTVTYAAMLPAGASVELEALVTPAREEGAPPGGAVLEFEAGAPAKLEKTPQGIRWTKTVSVAPFAAGAIALPGPKLVYVSPSGERTPVRPPALALTVTSRLPEGQKPEQLSPKPERDVRIPSRSPWFWVAIAGSVLALAALVWAIVRRRKAPAAADAEAARPAVPPGAELLAALEKLARDAARLGDDTRGFYSDLTRATKRYLERRLGLPVLEWTTFETLRRMRDAGVEAPREAGLAELLASADRVKFGRGSSTRAEAADHLRRARLLHDHFETRAAEEEARAAAADVARSARGGKSA